jgi:hypothetical protein
MFISVNQYGKQKEGTVVKAQSRATEKARSNAGRTSGGEQLPAIHTSDLVTRFFQLDEAICLVSTACRAIEGIEAEDGEAGSVELQEPVLALRYGVNALRQAYHALDVAMQARVR